MARNQEMSIYVWDVSPSMHKHLSAVREYLKEQMIQKLMFTPKDQVALVVFGSDETVNNLNANYGGYTNVAILSRVKPVENDIFGILEHARKGRAKGDFLDAMVVAVDHVLDATKDVPVPKGSKRLYLITDGASVLNPPFLETDTMGDQFDKLADQMELKGIGVTALLVRPPGAPVSDAMRENEALLQRFCERLREKVQDVPSVGLLLNRIKHRVAPSTLYRQTLEVTPNLSVKVWVYKKTSAQHFPSLKMLSDRAPPHDPTATRSVKMEREYKMSTNADVVVPIDQQVKAYRYGPQVVPVAELDRQVLQFNAAKGVKLLGFTDAANIPRHFYLSDVNLFIPEPNDPKSTAAVSALARALHDAGKVAIVRCKFQERKGLGVTMGVLTPNLAPEFEPSVADSFFFNVLPFAEDIREFTFAAFEEQPQERLPTGAQEAAAENFVRALDLAPRGAEEACQPDETPNPILQRYYKAVLQRVVSPNLEVPPLDDALRRLVELDPALVKSAGGAVPEFSSAFSLREAPGKKGKSSRRYWSDRLAEAEARGRGPPGEQGGEDGGAGPSETGASGVSLEGLGGPGGGGGGSGTAAEVGRVNPVGDFDALLARRDGDQWVPRALRGMKRVVEDLLDSAYNGNTYAKALSCFEALRRGCVVQQEPSDFNEFLRYLQTKCRGRRLDDFWQQVVASATTLISKEEAEDSLVTAEEAASFLTGKRQAAVQEEAEEDADDDLDAVLEALE